MFDKLFFIHLIGLKNKPKIIIRHFHSIVYYTKGLFIVIVKELFINLFRGSHSFYMLKYISRWIV
jgi:hypothetical protein